MAKTLKSLVLTAAVAATTLAPLAEAQADHRWRDRDRVVHRHHDNAGAAVAAGIIGLAVGAIIAGSVAPRRVRPAPVAPRHPAYYPPAPVDAGDEPSVVYADDIDSYGAPEPWTRDWFIYCRNRFRSFDPESGTYLGYDGRRHFCVAR